MKERKHVQRSLLLDSIKTAVIGIVTAFVANFLLQLFQNKLDFSIARLFAFEWHTEIFLMSMGILFIFYLWLTALLGSRWTSSFLVLGLSLLLGTITWQKMTTRGEPFYPSDLRMISEVSFLVKMVPLWLLVVGASLIVIVILAVVLYKKKFQRNEKIRKEKRWIIRGCTFLITSLLLLYVSLFNQEGNKVRAAFDPYAYWIPYSQQMNYYNNGFIGGFLYNLRMKSVEEPDNYSKEAMEKLVAKYQQEAEKINQTRDQTFEGINLIFIMNESFSDPMALEGLMANEDPIPYIRDLKKKTVSGNVFAEGYGGGTANSEYEALTGFSIEPLATNVATPYTQLATKMQKLPNISRLLSQRSYATTAIHPFDTTMYKRSEVYDAFGFQTFLDKDTMNYTAKKEQNPYISDAAAYQEVLHHLKETDQSDFIHLVTMQNHMGYFGKYPSTSFDVNGSGDHEQARNYFQDLRYSDQAIETFLNAVDHLDEKTMVVFWGDHLPGFYGESIKENNSILALHQTPAFVYANFETTKASFGTISPIFLMNHVLTAAHAKVTPYQAFLMQLESYLPAFEKGRYLEKGTEELKEMRTDLKPETQVLLQEYSELQYDLLEGKQYTKEADFYE